MNKHLIAVPVLVAAACGGSTPEWEAAYADVLAERYEEMPAGDLFEVCALIEPMSDEDFRQLIALDGTEGSDLEQVAADLDYELTTDDYNTAADMVIDATRSACA